MRKLDTTKNGKIRSNRKNYFNLLINDLPLTGGLFIDITVDEPAKMINNKVAPFTVKDVNIFRMYFAESYKLNNVKLLEEALESVMAINTVTKYERKTYKRVAVWFDYIDQLDWDVLLDKAVIREIIEGPSKRVINGLYNALLIQANNVGIAAEFKSTWNKVVKENDKLQKKLDREKTRVLAPIDFPADDELPF